MIELLPEASGAIFASFRYEVRLSVRFSTTTAGFPPNGTDAEFMEFFFGYNYVVIRRLSISGRAKKCLPNDLYVTGKAMTKGSKITKISGTGQGDQERGRAIIWGIASFKLLKGLLLLVVAVGALRLLNEDIASKMRDWVAVLGIDPDNHYIDALLIRIAPLDNHKLEEIGAGSFFYSALLLTEGIGLFLRKRWAEYFTIIVTGSFIPLEIYELTRKYSLTKIVILLGNIAIVVYLAISVVKKQKKQ